MVSYRTQPRADCVCGVALVPGPPDVVRDFALGTVQFARCSACGSFVQSPQFDAASLTAWYDSPEYRGTSTVAGAGYHDYFADEANRIAEARDRVARDLAPLLPPQARVLEIGCATGSMLVALREAGHEVVGIDLSAEFARYGIEQHKLDVRCADFLTADLGPRPFDMILLFGTVSNLIDPLAHLARARELLRDRGILVANLPLADSLAARLYGRRFWMFTPSVASFMSRKGIIELLRRSGFMDVHMAPDRQRPSLGKLLHHARLPGALRFMGRLGLAEARLPLAVPIPGVACIVARR